MMNCKGIVPLNNEFSNPFLILTNPTSKGLCKKMSITSYMSDRFTPGDITPHVLNMDHEGVIHGFLGKLSCGHTSMKPLALYIIIETTDTLTTTTNGLPSQ